jgi:aldehyde dehydrogenase (NAD+)
MGVHIRLEHIMAMDGGANVDTSEIPEIVAGLRRMFRTGRTRPLEWRKRQLQGIEAMFRERETVFLDALHADLRKPAFEATAVETAVVPGEVRHILAHLDEWVKPTKVRTNLPNQPGKSRIHHDPLGVVAIIGPWNYPLALIMNALAGAVAAGNCAVVKPSELAPRSAEALATWLPRYVDPDCVKVVTGGVSQTTALLAEKLDHIHFTGGTAIGKIVMAAAAKHLTPVTLELGGKCPVVIDRDADLDVAAKRIANAKFVNAGQSCVAPDYLLVDRTVESALVERITSVIRDFFGDDPQKSDSYARIINERHHARLVALLDEGEIVCGGQHDVGDKYIAPTVIRGIKGHEKIMEDEIFGPILPVLAVDGLDEAMDFITARPKPLASYIFTRDKGKTRRFVEETTAGGVTVNDVALHFFVPDLPFGGVGDSGMGAYHGLASFEAFSHQKAVLYKGTMIDPSLRYPPYTENARKWVKRFL